MGEFPRELLVFEGGEGTSIREVKARVAASGGPGVFLQNLMLEDRTLRDDETFGSLSLAGDATLYMVAKDLDVMGLLERLRSSKPRTEWPISQEDLEKVVDLAVEIFLSEPCLVDLAAPVNVCGAVMGNFQQLCWIFDRLGDPGQAKYVFLGSYVDRGDQSIETMATLLLFKCRYPDRLVLLRGRHECQSINRIYGFYDECRRRCSLKFWKTWTNVFNCMPCCARIQHRILCVPNGLSLDLQNAGTFDKINRIVRPTDVPDEGLLYDLLWGEPDQRVRGFVDEVRMRSCFGPDVVAPFLETHGLDLICRSALVEEGFEFFAGTPLVALASSI
ncbi:gsp-1, partial [Symbiodinium natans]